MNAVQLLEEVRRVPGYGNPEVDPRFFYGRVLETINARRDELPAYTLGGRRQSFEAIFGSTPFDYVDFMLQNIQNDSLDARKLQSDRDVFISFHKNMVIGTLDKLIGQAMQQRGLEDQNFRSATPAYTQDLDFIRQMPSRLARYFRQHPQIGLEQDEIELHKYNHGTLAELKALRELIELYARAAIGQHGKRLEFLFDALGQNTPPNAPVESRWAFRIKPS